MNKFPLHYQFNEKHNEFFNTFKVLKKEEKTEIVETIWSNTPNDDFFFTTGTIVKFNLTKYSCFEDEMKIII